MRNWSDNIWESIRAFAIQGGLAWTAYAVIECLCVSILPWIIKQNSEYIPVHWGATLVLSSFYVLVGVTLGALCGLFFNLAAKRVAAMQKLHSRNLLLTVGTVTVVCAFVANLFFNFSLSRYESIGLSELPSLSISALLMALLALSAVSTTWLNRLRFITNPWTVSILLLGLPWANLEVATYYSTAIKGALALALFCTIVFISYIVQKVMNKRERISIDLDVQKHLAQSFVFPGLALLAVIGISCFLKQAPPKITTNLNAPILGSDRPNVILIVMDTVRADHLSLYGYARETTPNLKEFAEEATLYNLAVAPGDMTLTTHASMFTGLLVKKHGAHSNPPKHVAGRPLDDSFHTIAEILSEKGYTTAGISSNYSYLGPYYNLDQGFQYYDARRRIPWLGHTKLYLLRQGVRNVLSYFVSPTHFELWYRQADEINSEVFTTLARLQGEGRPFFLFINYMDAHWPYLPPAPFDDFYPGKLKNFHTAHYMAMQEEVMKFERKITPAEYGHLTSQYDGAIAYLDHQLSELITKLKEIGFYRNSMIIITADHGEAFGQKAYVGHGLSVYQDQVHVPLIIKYPDSKRKAVVNEYVSLVNLMPTVLDILDYPIPQNIDGTSLRKTEPPSRLVISESYPDGWMFELHDRFHRVERALYSKSLKYISSTAGKRELYELSRDPNEMIDLYPANNKVAKKLETRLTQWLNQQGETEETSAVKLDQDTLDRLKSLGYVR
jgi:arylsulfatase A-like enzyme